MFKNFAGAAGIGLISRVVGLVSDVYMKRMVGAGPVGMVSWNAWALTCAAMLSNPGLQTVARREAAKSPARVAELLLSTVFLQSVPLFLVLIASFISWSVGLRPGLAGLLLVIQAIGTFSGALQLRWAFEAADRYVILNVLGLMSVALNGLGIVLLVNEPDDIVEVALIQLVCSLLLVAATFAVAFRSGIMTFGALRQARHTAFNGLGAMYRDAFPLTMASVATVVSAASIPLTLGPTHGDEAVGLYATSHGAIMLAFTVAGTLQTVYFANLARAVAVDDQGTSARRIAYEFLRVVMLVTAPLGFLGWAVGRHVLTIVYGPSFAEAGPYFEWLSLALVLMGITSGMSTPLLAGGFNKAFMRVTLVGVVTNLSLNFLLVPRYALLGATITLVVAELVVCLKVCHTRRRLLPVPLSHQLPMLGLMFLIALTGRWLAHEFPGNWPLILLGLVVLMGSVLAYMNRPLIRRVLDRVLKRPSSQPQE